MGQDGGSGLLALTIMLRDVAWQGKGHAIILIPLGIDCRQAIVSARELELELEVEDLTKKLATQLH